MKEFTRLSDYQRLYIIMFFVAFMIRNFEDYVDLHKFSCSRSGQNYLTTGAVGGLPF